MCPTDTSSDQLLLLCVRQARRNTSVGDTGDDGERRRPAREAAVSVVAVAAARGT
jgi:hypothetical protein